MPSLLNTLRRTLRALRSFCNGRHKEYESSNKVSKNVRASVFTMIISTKSTSTAIVTAISPWSRYSMSLYCHNHRGDAHRRMMHSCSIHLQRHYSHCHRCHHHHFHRHRHCHGISHRHCHHINFKDSELDHINRGKATLTLESAKKAEEQKLNKMFEKNFLN